MAQSMPNPALATRGMAEALSIRDESKIIAPLAGAQSFRAIAEVVDDLIRHLRCVRYGAMPCPLDRERFIAIDGGGLAFAAEGPGAS